MIIFANVCVLTLEIDDMELALQYDMLKRRFVRWDLEVAELKVYLQAFIDSACKASRQNISWSNDNFDNCILNG